MILKHQELYQYTGENLTDKCVCSDCSTNWPFFHLFPSLRASLFSETQWYLKRPINNPTMAFECSSERKSCTYLTVNQKLEMIGLNVEVISKAQIAQKLGLLYQLARLWMQRKTSWRKLKVLFQGTHKMKRKLIAAVEKVLVAWIEDQTSHSIPWSQNLTQSKALTLF